MSDLFFVLSFVAMFFLACAGLSGKSFWAELARLFICLSCMTFLVKN